MITVTSTSLYGPAAICRMDQDLVRHLVEDREHRALFAGACLVILAGAASYGAVFGIWHSPTQALYAAVKMPILILSVTLSSGIINAMLAQVMGSGVSFRQVGLCILLSFAVTSALLGALSPAVLFIVSQIPSNGQGDPLVNYGFLLAGHTVVVGFCGTVGVVSLYRLLIVLTGSRPMALRVLWTWFLISGLAGCELSWVLSPFLARTDIPLPFFNPNAFSTNFFEYLWRAVNGGL